MQALASAVVLREIHCALLRGVEGKDLGKPDQATPQAKVSSADSSAATSWTERTARAILAAPLASIDDSVRVRPCPMPAREARRNFMNVQARLCRVHHFFY